MSPTQKKRMLLVVSLVSGLTLSIALTLYALSQNINLFYSPAEVFKQRIPAGKTIRVGGVVVKNSVKRKNDLSVEFVVTDYEQQLTVHYRGILPDLFKEGQGVVAQGQFNSDQKFVAKEVLAKHDEKYMPPEVAANLKKENV